jgi:hypothetical protein
LDRIKIARVAGTPPPTLADAVAVGTCSFWGDLDLAGLDIFIKLRGLVPHLALSALYGPMLAAAADNATNHPYCALVDKAGQVETTGPLSESEYSGGFQSAGDFHALWANNACGDAEVERNWSNLVALLRALIIFQDSAIALA